MPVDKFGRSGKSNSVITEGVSLSYIGNNFLRRDGTNTANGSINMTGNTLTNVSNPVNAQDVATKNYVEQNTILRNGTYSNDDWKSEHGQLFYQQLTKPRKRSGCRD